MTKPQLKALHYLASVKYATPSEIGEAMGGTRSNKAQGLGRMGGSMGSRLVKMGMAYHSGYRRGFPAYQISAKGRNASDEAKAALDE